MPDNSGKVTRGTGGKFVKKTAAPPTQLAPPAAGQTYDEPTSAYSPGYAPGGFMWAAEHIVNGNTVRRASWLGNKSIGITHPSRNILENEDFLAQDWVLV